MPSRQMCCGIKRKIRMGVEAVEDTILQVRGITKEFPGVKALDDVTFSVKRGTIHALMGENGAGKSTLIKILAGIYVNYQGEVELDGQILKLKSPADAQRLGISVVHQELKLCETLSITENIFLGNLIYKNGLVDWKEMHRLAGEMIGSLGMNLKVEQLVDTLSVAQKQIVEICKAVNHNCKLLIMDEPSATLTEKELDVMFDIMDKLVKSGVTIIYISHRMEEIFHLADDITVLRDGQFVKTLRATECTRPQLINLMVGRTVEQEYPKEQIPLGEIVLEVENLTQKGRFEDVSFTLKKGEILGFSGLVGAGRTEVMLALLGLTRPDRGTVRLKGKTIVNRNFRDAIARGFGLIPEDRKKQGLVQIDSVSENICMSSLGKIMRGGIIQKKLERCIARKYVDMLSVATPDTDTEVQYLSGGNQQKVVISKWLLADSEIIIMDEPTRGIDVGAKSEIYRLMGNLVKQGKSIIMISSEMPEIIGMCDRIVVMYEGHKVGELEGKEATQEHIMALCV